MSRREDNIAKHHLGVAKKYLRKIIDHQNDYWETDTDAKATMRHYAEEALMEMEKIK